MKVLFDASVLGSARSNAHSRTGVHRAAEERSRFLIQHDDVELNWIVHGNTDSLWDFIALTKEDPSLDLPLRASLGRRRCFDTLERALAISRLNKIFHRLPAKIEGWKRQATFSPSMVADADIVHSPFHCLPNLGNLANGTVRFQTLHDLIPIKFPEYFPAGAAERFRMTIDELHGGDWVLCSSESTRNDLLNYRDDLSTQQIRVTPLAAADHFKPCTDGDRINEVRRKYGLTDDVRYLLSVATFEPRKNIKHLVSVFDNLQNELDDDVRLVLVGVEGWKTRELLDSLTEKSESRIAVTGYVPDEDLSPLYSDAIAFLYPSLYEGFGLPPLEAMQCGTAVVTSTSSSLPEVVGDAAVKVRADSDTELADAILRLLSDTQWRASLEFAGLDQARKFSWQRCGDLTVEAYRDALSRS